MNTLLAYIMLAFLAVFLFFAISFALVLALACRGLAWYDSRKPLPNSAFCTLPSALK